MRENEAREVMADLTRTLPATWTVELSVFAPNVHRERADYAVMARSPSSNLSVYCNDYSPRKYRLDFAERSSESATARSTEAILPLFSDLLEEETALLRILREDLGA